MTPKFVKASWRGEFWSSGSLIAAAVVMWVEDTVVIMYCWLFWEYWCRICLPVIYITLNWTRAEIFPPNWHLHPLHFYWDHVTQSWLPFPKQHCPQSVNLYVHVFHFLWMFTHWQPLVFSMKDNFSFNSFLMFCNWNVML